MADTNEVKTYPRAWLRSKKYRGYADILNTLLNPAEKYSEQDVDRIVNNFMQGVK